MSQSSTGAAPVSSPQAPATTPSGSSGSSRIEGIFDAALKSYKKKTKKDLINHDLFKRLESCDSPAAILAVFQAAEFDQSRMAGDDRLKKWLIPTINVLYAFSDTLGGGVSLVFSPAKIIFAGVGVLLLAAKGVAESLSILVDIFGRIENFFVRLEVYTEVPLTPAMTDKMVQITVEILGVLATATKEMGQCRAKKFLKKLAGRTDLEGGLKKLEKLTNEEIAMASARLVKVTDNIDNKVTEVGDGVRCVDGKVQVVTEEVRAVGGEVQVVRRDVLAVEGEVQVVKEDVQVVISEVQVVNDNVQAVGDKLQTIADDGKATATGVKLLVQRATDNVDDVKRNQLRESLRKWQSPPDPSTNHNIAGDRQHEGTAEWFVESDKFEKWKVDGSLLWIHGKPGSGKSILCSAIINDVTTLCEAGSASMAYFYFDFRDVDKQARRNLLPSLLVQLSNHSDACCDVLSCLYKTHGNGTHQPNDKALTECLKEMLTLPNQGPVYLIFDAVDECPDTSDIPSPRSKVLDLINDLMGLRLPNLHICATSRPEVDICDLLESIASQTVSLQDESGQKKDITDYVRFVVYSDSGKFMRRLRKEEKEHVVETLSEKADGMFRWVFCQLEMLQKCLPQNVRRVLKDLPNSLDETYERMLREIGRVNPAQAYHLLQCLTVATRPLRVEELAEVLALDFDETEEGIPALNEDWRWDNHQQVVLSTCSSLIVVVDYHGDSDSGEGFPTTRVVQFAHFSVKEFLTADRLAKLKADIAHFHIRLESAHTVMAQACLAILLQSDHDDASKSGSSLSDYADRHWVGHAQFENVSLRVEHGMRRLFNPANLYFTTWLMSYDVDEQWLCFEQGRYRTVLSPESSEDYAALSLYYAALCGFHDLTKHLIAEYPEHVNARVGLNQSPLAAALYKGHIQVAELLHQHGAVLPIGSRGYTLLHAASKDGLRDVAQWLLNIGEDANAQEDDYKTPLHLATAEGHLELVRTLLGHGVDVNAVSEHNRTALHEASVYGHVEIARILIKNGADLSARDRNQRTALHLASSKGDAKAVHLLIEHGADIEERDEDQMAPLHLASSKGSTEAVKLLIKVGAHVNAEDNSQSTPLHLASSKGKAEAVRLLIQLGAQVNAKDNNQLTPLHLASANGRAEVVQSLIELGADINMQDESQSTPLHIASSLLLPDIETVVRLLIEHGAGVNTYDRYHRTPLQCLASSRRPSTRSMRLLLENGADVDVQDDEGLTPFQIASSKGHTQIAQMLLDHRTTVVSNDRM